MGRAGVCRGRENAGWAVVRAARLCGLRAARAGSKAGQAGSLRLRAGAAGSGGRRLQQAGWGVCTARDALEKGEARPVLEALDCQNACAWSGL